MSGMDPDTKKYVGPEAAIKKEIASIEQDKSLKPDDKKVQLEQLWETMKSLPPAVQFPANIELVTKYYDAPQCRRTSKLLKMRGRSSSQLAGGQVTRALSGPRQTECR
jgi:hypothetical protein